MSKRRIMFWVTSFVATIALMIWIPDRLRFVIADVDLGFQVIMRAFAGLMFGIPVILALLKFVGWDETRKGSSLEAVNHIPGCLTSLALPIVPPAEVFFEPDVQTDE